MEEYKEENKERIKLSDDLSPKVAVESKSTNYFTQLLQNLYNFYQQKDFDSQFRVFQEIIDGLDEGKCEFPADVYFQEGFFALISDFILTVESVATQENWFVIFECINKVMRQSESLCESFFNSPVFDGLFNYFLANDELTECILPIVAYIVNINNNGLRKILSFGCANVLDKISTILYNEEEMNSRSVNSTNECILIISKLVSYIDPSDTERLELFFGYMVNFIGVTIGPQIDPRFYQYVYRILDGGIQKALDTNPDLVQCLIKNNVIERINISLKTILENSDESDLDIFRTTTNMLVKISSFALHVEIYNHDKLPEFVETLKACCLFPDDIVSKNALGAVANFIGGDDISVQNIIDHNFSNEVILECIDRSYGVKENTMNVVYEIVKASKPQELLMSLSPTILRKLAEEIVECGKGNDGRWILIICEIVDSALVLGFKKDIQGCFLSSEFYNFLKDSLFEQEGDPFIQEKIRDLIEKLGFYDDEDDEEDE